MAFCKSCGTDIGEAKFCSSCGASQEVTPVQIVSEPISAPVFTPSPSAYASSGDTYGSSSPEAPPVFTPAPSTYASSGDTYEASSSEVPPVFTAPVYSDGTMNKPNTTGSMVFSIVNIALGLLLCCCTGVSIISMVLGIVALVFTSQAGKAATTEEALKKLKSAKIMNIIGVALLALGLVIGLIIVLVSGTGMWTDALSNYGYSY